MAWSTSNGNAAYLLGLGTKTYNVATDSFFIALFSNGVTPAQSASVSVNAYNGAGSQWGATNEVSGTGYSPGGASVSGVSWTQSTNVDTFTSSATPTWGPPATFTTYGCLIYDSTVSNVGIAWLSFSGIQEVTAGTFSVAFNASGILTLTC